MKNDGTLDVSAEQRETIRKLEQRILDLEAKLVQRDVYEAEQRLPPEQAVLIKHLKTVERCINEGPVTYHYAEESDCSFCGEWQGHTRDCAWVELQMDRGVTSVIDYIHVVALQEHERRELTLYARSAHRALSPEEIARAAQAVERSREQTIGNMRVYTNPNVAPGTVFVMQPSSFMNPLEVTRVDMPDHAPVAPPDDEDVP